MSARQPRSETRKIVTPFAHDNAGARTRRGGPRRRDRLAIMLALLERVWHLNATGNHKAQWEIARHLVAAVAAVTKAQRTR